MTFKSPCNLIPLLLCSFPCLAIFFTVFLFFRCYCPSFWGSQDPSSNLPPPAASCCGAHSLLWCTHLLGFHGNGLHSISLPRGEVARCSLSWESVLFSPCWGGTNEEKGATEKVELSYRDMGQRGADTAMDAWCMGQNLTRRLLPANMHHDYRCL